MDKVIDLKPKTGGIIKNIVITAIVVLIGIILVANLFVTVPAGFSGVVLTFGKVEKGVLREGLHVKIPFVQQVIMIDNHVLKTDVNCSSASKDLQTVSSTISVNYRVDANNSAELYQNVGVGYEIVIIQPAIQECVKAVTAQYTAEELITKRQMVGEEMRAELAKKINPYGLSIEVFNIITFDFSEEFNRAIEAKQTAQQNALKAEQDLQRIKVEAQQEIEKAKAEAEAYKIKSQEITNEMILMEYIKKWNGEMPKVVASENGGLMFDLSGLEIDSNKTSGTPAIQE